VFENISQRSKISGMTELFEFQAAFVKYIVCTIWKKVIIFPILTSDAPGCTKRFHVNLFCECEVKVLL